MTVDLITFVVGAACYCTSTGISIRLREDLDVPTAPALAPAVALLGLGLRPLHGAFALVAVAMAVLVMAVALRRPALEAAGHSVMFLLMAVMLGVATGPAPGTSVRPVLVAAVATPLYAIGDLLRQWLAGSRGVDREERAMWLLLQGVLVCGAGLTVLMSDRIGWSAFVAMTAVLALTHREFAAFAVSRAAYEQTIHAIERLRLLDRTESRARS